MSDDIPVQAMKNAFKWMFRNGKTLQSLANGAVAKRPSDEDMHWPERWTAANWRWFLDSHSETTAP